MSSEPKPVVSMARFRGTVDETGQQVTVDVPRRRKRKKGWREHVTLLDLDVITRLEMTGAELRLLWAIASFIPEKGGVESRCSLAEVAARLGVAESNVSRTIKGMRERHILRTVRRGVHVVNPWILYNGDFDSWNAEADDWPEPVWRRDGADPETGEIR